MFITIPFDGVLLEADLCVPENAKGIVVFAHGSGSSRHSSRNKYVAEYFNQRHFATLLMNLLMEEENLDHDKSFDIPLLADRFERATVWLKKQDNIKNLPVGYFGASTGAAVALISAVFLGDQVVKAVVSRGGRPDLVLSKLEKIKSPTLLIVGSKDYEVLNLNDVAYEKLNCERKFDIVSGATHLFEEPGTLDEVAHKALEWFEKYLH